MKTLKYLSLAMLLYSPAMIFGDCAGPMADATKRANETVTTSSASYKAGFSRGESSGFIVAMINFYGSIDKIPAEKITALSGGQLQAIGSNIKNLTPEQFSALTQDQIDKLSTSQIKTLTPDQRSKLSATSIAGFSNAQINALTPEQTKALTPEQINALTASQILGFKPEQISSFTSLYFVLPDHIKKWSLSQMKAITPEQIKTLKPECIKVLSVDTQGTNAQLNGLSTKQFQALTPDQIKALTNHQIDFLQRDLVKALTASQVAAFSHAQLMRPLWRIGNKGDIKLYLALGAEQFGYLTPAQIKSLKTEEIKELQKDHIAQLKKEQIEALSYTQLATPIRRENNTILYRVLDPSKQSAVSLDLIAKIGAANI